MTYEYIAYVSSGNVNSGEEVLRVTAEGEFIWNENADEMIASGDYSQYPALRHVLKALRENERIKAENERLRELLNKLEYFSDGTIRRHPTESEVEAALVAAEKDKEIKRLQDMLYEQLGKLTALRAEKQMRERIKEIKEEPR